jgi:hypothetical protein
MPTLLAETKRTSFFTDVAFPTDDADVQRFHEATTIGGQRRNGPPGERPRYHPGYYVAYILDPDGDKVEVVDHHRA